MKQLLDFISARHELMFEMDEEIKRLRFSDQDMNNFFEKKRVGLSLPIPKSKIRERLPFIAHMQMQLLKLKKDFYDIPLSDFHECLSQHPVSHTLGLNNSQGLAQYFDFSSYYSVGGKSDPEESNRLVHYYICFFLLKAPTLFSKLMNRMREAKLIAPYKLHKSGITIGNSFLFKIDPPCIHIAKFEDQLNKYWLSIAREDNSFVFCHEEILFFHELVHMVHLFTGRFLGKDNPIAPSQEIHALRPLSDPKKERYATRYEQYSDIQDRFGNPIKEFLFEEFHTIHGTMRSPTHKAELMPGSTLNEQLTGLQRHQLNYLCQLKVKKSQF